MAVSYLSQDFKPTPYELPISLDLMGQVLQYKDNLFKQNASKVQSQIDAFGSLDVMRGVDKEYLNKKINNLVNNVNSLGGVDLSDNNTLNKIESMGSDIYNDNNVMNAISSTHAIRTLQSNIDKIKTNPKMKGMYSPANEEWDMKPIQDYLTSSQLGDSFKGSTSPTPYTNVDKTIAETLKQKKANLVETYNGNGYYTLKGSNKTISEYELSQIAYDEISSDPTIANQIKINSNYFGKTKSPEELANNVISTEQDKLDFFKSKKQYLQERYDAAIGDEKSRDILHDSMNELDSYIKKQDNYVNTLKNGNPTENKLSALEDAKRNPDSYREQHYINTLVRGLSKTFAINESKMDVKENKSQMFYDALNLKATEKGLRMSKDPLTGQIQFTPDNKLIEELHLVKPTTTKDSKGNKQLVPNTTETFGSNNTDKPKDLLLTDNKILNENSSLINDRNNTVTNLISELKKQDPTILENLKNVKLNTPEGLSKALDYVTNIMVDYNKKSLNLPNSLPNDINPSIIKAYQDIDLKNRKLALNTYIYNKANAIGVENLKNIGLTDDDIKLYTKGYSNTPQKPRFELKPEYQKAYNSGVLNMQLGRPLSQMEIKAINTQKQIEDSNKKNQQEYQNTALKLTQIKGKVQKWIGENKDRIYGDNSKNVNFLNYTVDDVVGDKSKYNLEKQTLINNKAINIPNITTKDIRITGVGKKNNEGVPTVYFNYNVRDKNGKIKSIEKGEAATDDTILKALGYNDGGAYDADITNKEVKVYGESKNNIMASAKRGLVLNYDIVKSNSDSDNEDSFIRIKTNQNGKDRYITLPNPEQGSGINFESTPSLVKSYLQSIINNYEQVKLNNKQKVDLSEFLDYIKTFKSNTPQ